MKKQITVGFEKPINPSNVAFLNHVEQHALNAWKGQLHLIYPRTQKIVLYRYMDYVFLIYFNLIEEDKFKGWVAEVKNF